MSPIPGIPVEAAVIEGVQWLRLGIDAIGAAVLGGGVVIAMAKVVAASTRRLSPDFTSVRLSLARYLALALELQLGADILSTAVAPSWDQIGKLGAIAAIRTSLNFFLMRELQEAGEMPSARAEG
jgi:uncharacterized membrane protein